MADEKLVISSKEAARRLGIGLNRLYTLARQPGFPVSTLSTPSKLLVNAAGLERWLAAQEAEDHGENF